MTDTHVLLDRIAALRQRLEQAQGLAREAGSVAVALSEAARDDAGRVWRLERVVNTGKENAALLDNALRQFAETSAGAGDGDHMPRQLTARARRVLERAHILLGQLRELADQVEAVATRGPRSGDPLAHLYRDTSAMTEMVLRVVQAFPDSASAQLRLCDGVEAILTVAGERLATLAYAVAERRQQTERLDALSELLTRLAAGDNVAVRDFIALAETVLAEADQKPLPFPSRAAAEPARLIASHGLLVAHILARLARHDPDLRARPLEPVLAALVHDVGMLHVPAEVLMQPGPLSDEQRRTVERHTQIGADLAARLLPSGAWLAEAVRGHHERLDGTGYPDGLREPHIAPLTRLLAVCDVYAALGSPRPHRAARETRTALADTLLQADQGVLDPRAAERLLLLSFYPVGSVVELADGATGMVVATHMTPPDLNTPARPVVALLTDSSGQPLPVPRHLDLASSEGHAIVRTLSAVERRGVLGERYPDLA